MTTKKAPPTESASAGIRMIPLCKLKKSPRNARKMPHPKADIEALAASIAVNGILQNPVVERETKDGKPTGYYLVTIGEGRRQAQLLRARRKEIARNEPVRCLVDTTHNPLEISLAENAIRSAMHPADQFEAFHELHTAQGMSAEDIGARFGVTPAVVRQRLTLACISPVLMQAYRAGALDLSQLTAFAITEDHARQEAVFEALPEDADRADILAALNDAHVAASDPRARFIGEDAYRAAGGAIIRDLFEEDGLTFFVDAPLLDRLLRERLEQAAAEVRGEGWKWIEIMPRQDHAFTADMRRVYPSPAPVSDEDQSKLDALEAAYDAFEVDDTEESERDLERIEGAIAALRGEDRYALEDIAIAGVIVGLTYNGALRIERGYVRSEDDTRRASAKQKKPRGEGPPPLSAKLVAELTAHRTMALRQALGANPDVALTAAVHALALDAFFTHADKSSCLEISARQHWLGNAAPGIEESAPAQAVTARHEAWAQRLGDDPARLFEAIAAMAQAERLALLAHCLSLTVDAVLKSGEVAEGDDSAVPLAQALGVDMARHWQPTPQNYLGRVSKQRILEAVREAVSAEAAENIASLKKSALAEAAAARLKDRGWLPAILRTPLAPCPQAQAA